MYCRFVDDVYCHDDDKETCDRFMETLNSLHPALKFTSDGENNGTLSFLDVSISRNMDTHMDTTIYRKPTFTGLYIPWSSFTPTKSKTHLVKALVYRAHRICSPHLLDEELERLLTIMTKNGYPKTLLMKLINQKPTLEKTITFGPERCPVVLRLPWVDAGSSRVEKEVRNIVCSSYPCVKLYVIFGTTRAFSVKKDVLPTLSKNNLIYFFQCRNFENRYVGRTFQHLGARIRQHVPLNLVPVAARGSRPQRGRPPKCPVQSVAEVDLSKSAVDTLADASSFSSGAGLGPTQATVNKKKRPIRKPPKLTSGQSSPGRVTRSQLRRRIDDESKEPILEVTTTVNVKKRGRPRKQDRLDVEQHTDLDRGNRNCRDAGRNGRDSQAAGSEVTTAKSSGQGNGTSAVKCHLSGSASCREWYSDDVFSVLSGGRSLLHLAVLEALYIHKLDPELCVQKEKVLSLQLFGTVRREGAK